MSQEIWRVPRVLSYTGKSRSSFYSDISQGLWTRPVKLSQRSVGWPAREVEVLMGALISGLDEDSIKQLVEHLERFRTQNGARV